MKILPSLYDEVTLVMKNYKPHCDFLSFIDIQSNS
jgi:hypothetical protein